MATLLARSGQRAGANRPVRSGQRAGANRPVRSG
jgi:hypothetical protein